MADPNLNTLLKWGVENSNVSEGAEGPKTQLNSEALAALFGGNMKSDAQMMKDNMEVIKRDECEPVCPKSSDGSTVPVANNLYLKARQSRSILCEPLRLQSG